MKIYVGNLSRDVSEGELKEAFAAFGEIASVAIITDKYSGESRGFGFVEMPKQEEATAAINAMNGKAIKGRNLTVNEARPKEDRGGRGGFGGGGGRGPRGGGGGGRRPW
jgi:RNA recognition motif-containing protein